MSGLSSGVRLVLLTEKEDDVGRERFWREGSDYGRRVISSGSLMAPFPLLKLDPYYNMCITSFVWIDGMGSLCVWMTFS